MRISDWSSDVCSSDLGIPKTLIQHLIRWTIETKQFDFDTGATLYSILGTEISPELVPADADGAIQSTQDMIGPNELHDFFLHYVVRKGMGPTKIAFLAWKAWGNDKLGEWPVGFPESERRAYDFATIRKWLRSEECRVGKECVSTVRSR